MTESPTGEYVAECFWPGVDEAAVRALDALAAARAEGCAAPARPSATSARS
jgi:hypothetical protein